MTTSIGLVVTRDGFEFPFDAHQQTHALAVFVSNDDEMRSGVSDLALKAADADDLADDLQDYFADLTGQLIAGNGDVENLASKIIRNWLEDVEWHSLAEYAQHITHLRYPGFRPTQETNA